MKILTTFSGKEYLLEDDEAEKVVQVKNSSAKAFMALRCGAFLDSSAIESITGIPLILMAHGRYPLSKDGRSYIRDGQRVYVEDRSHIRKLPDPKYQELGSSQFELTSGKKYDFDGDEIKPNEIITKIS